MRALLQLPMGWLQRGPAWRRLTFLVLFVVIVAYGASGTLRPWQQAALWAALLLAATLYLRRHPVRLFGPVLAFDLVRTARKGHIFLIRGVYAATLLVVFFWVYASWFFRAGGSGSALLKGGSLDVRLSADFAESFFYTGTGVQWLAVFLLTPLYVGSALAEEKEKRTLEYLLTTELEDPEIVLGKLLVRVGQLLLVVLAGVPVIALTEFLGGVDPTLVAGSLATTALLTLSLAALSVLVSIYARGVLSAVLGAYFWSAVFLFLSWWLSQLVPAVCEMFTGTAPDHVTFGNPFVAIHLLQTTWVTAGDQGRYLAALLHDYAVAQGVFTILCVVWAVRRLRAVALRPEGPASGRHGPAIEFPPRRRRPRLHRQDPLLWKEVYSGADLGSPQLGAMLVYAQLVLGWLMVPAVLCGGVASTWLAVVMLLAVGLAAAGAVSGEREHGTLDSLLTLPVAADAILFAKWQGAILSVRSVWYCLGAILGLELLMTRVNVFALAPLVIAWGVYAAFLAGLGLCFSLRYASTLRAAMWTFSTVLGLAALLRLLGGHGEVFLAAVLPPGIARGLAQFLGSLAPFALLDRLHFGYGAGIGEPIPSAGELAATAAGLVAYTAAAWLLWRIARRAFRIAANRDPRRGLPPSTSEKAETRMPNVEPEPALRGD